METLRLVNSYGDVAYGKADNRVERRYTEGTSTDAYSSDRRGATGSGSRSGGATGASASGKGTRAPGTYGPGIKPKGGTSPKVGKPSAAKPKVTTAPNKAYASMQKARIATAEAALKKMVGWESRSPGVKYKVAKKGLAAALYVRGPADAGFVLLPVTDSRWLATVERAAQVYATEKRVKPLIAPRSGGTTGSSGTSGSGATPGTVSDSAPATDTGSGSGSTAAPVWFTQPYLNEMLAISGWTGPSYNMPGVTLEVKTVSLDGVSAPVIGVTSSTGMVDVTPAMAEWASYASNVIPSKAADDQRKASGAPAPSSSGGSSGGSTRVTSDTTSGDYSIWASDGVPSSDGSAPVTTMAPSSSSGGSSMRVVEDAPSETFAPSTEAAPTSEAVTLVSEEVATAEGEEGFLAKNKWYILGGSAALLGGYAYMHRMNPVKYPLPDYLSKWVR